MAHTLYFNEQTQQHSFFSVKQKACHGLGQIIEGYPNSATAIQLAGLDYEVVKRLLYTKDSHLPEEPLAPETNSPSLLVPD